MFMPVLTSPAVAQQRANDLGGEVYVSKLSRDDPNYGASNIDVEAFGTEALTKPWGDGFSYKIYLPEIPGFNQYDTILALNKHIAGWRAELARNEQMKVMPSVLVKNFSFTGGGDVKFSETAGIIAPKQNNYNITLRAEYHE